MPRKPMSQAERKAFGARMKAARAAKAYEKRREQAYGVSSRPHLKQQAAASTLNQLRSVVGPERGKSMPRGRRARQKAETPMSNAEMLARQQEAALLLGTEGGKKRRRGRRGKRGAGSRIIAIFTGGNKRSAGKSSRRKGTSMRRKNGNNGQQSYAQVTGQLPIQVSIEVAEGLFSLASVGVDIYTAGTKSAADDLAFPVVARVLSSAGRWGAQRFLSKKHSGLAATIAHGFSAMNGDRNGNFIRNQLRRYLQPAGGAPPL